ncbi:MAG: fibronectin type III domain-containing protein [Syntrophales bacterium]
MAASIDLLVSSEQLDSDMAGAPTVTLTAVVKDSANRALAGKEVSFAADSGVLAVTKGSTGADGTATATLGAGGNPQNRPIHLTAQTDSVSAVNTVNVTGTNISISGAASLSFGDSMPLTIFLKDSKGKGISGRIVTVASAKGNTLSSSAPVTNASGQAIVNVTATVGGTDKITASAIGATKDFDLMVNTTILRFVNPAPPAVTEIPIGTSQPVTVEYVSGTTPQTGVTVNFVTTRGVVSASSATTGADGRATISVSSTNSGPGLLVASVASGPSSQAAVEFVAPTVSSLIIQASPAVIGTNSGGLETERSLITGIVRDANNNLVKNKTVTFTIISDVSGGRLTPASSITDSFGEASTVFIAGASSGGLNGVTIRAAVQGTAVAATTTLTVAKKSLFIALASDNQIKKLDPAKYMKEYVALVTDSAGNPVVGATVVASVTPVYYQKGYFKGLYNIAGGFVKWIPVVTLEAASSTLPGVPACANEDGMLHNPLYDFNGVLDTNPSTGEKEDQNGNNRLDPGNVASVTSAVTDATGHATVQVVYARDYAYWVNVKLEAFANDLKGSTASATAVFTLPGSADDYNNEKVTPPGNPSPFGQSASCYVDLEVTPVSATQMALTWQRSPTANHYHIYRNGINIAPNIIANTYIDTGLSGGTLYCYQIRTVDAAGTESSFTGSVCSSTAVMPPSGLTATAISPSQIRLSWQPLAGATGYRIYRNGSLMPITSVVTTTTVDSGLSASTLYCYAVSANNAAGVESSKSGQMCATTQLSAPATPFGLTATGKQTPPTVMLSWSASAGACKYNIYRDGSVTPSFSLSAPAVSVIDNGLDLSPVGLKVLTNYCYTISAEDCSGNESNQSTQVCTATGGALVPSPTGLTATPLPGPQVRLTWNASAGAVGYRLYRTGADGVVTLLAGGTTLTDTETTSLAPTTGYCYTVSALDGAGTESAKSTAVCIVTGAKPPPPPTMLGATSGVNPMRVDLTWTQSTGAVSYRVYRNGGTIPLLSVAAVSASDTTVAASTQYCYTVSAVDASGNESAQSSAKCATTSAPPPPTPTNFSVTLGGGSFHLQWDDMAGAAFYNVYRKMDGAVDYGTPWWVVPAGVTPVTMVDVGVTSGHSYCYTVSAVSSLGSESSRATQVCIAP